MKRMKRRTNTRWNRCYRKTDDHLFHTTLNHHPPKMDVLPKCFLQIILAAKQLCAAFKYVPSTSSDDLCLLFCLILILCLYVPVVGLTERGVAHGQVEHAGRVQAQRHLDRKHVTILKKQLTNSQPKFFSQLFIMRIFVFLLLQESTPLPNFVSLVQSFVQL